MVSTILPGEILICQTQPNVNNILDGSVVVIVTTKHIAIKRFHLDEDPQFLLLEHDNPDKITKKDKINIADIQQVLIVRGKISSVLVPHHQIASKGKIKAMEEAIEFLKKELSSINEQLQNLQKN